MAMQTIPSRLTIWTSFKGLPTASPFFRAKRNDAAQFGCAVLTDSASRAKRNDAARRSDGARKFQSPWGGTLGQPHGLFNFPALIRTPLADLLAHARTFSRHLYSPDGLSLINWRMSCAIAAARLWLPPAAPPVLCHLQLRCTCAQCPSLLVRESFRHLAPARGILALLSVSLFRIRPVMVIFPLRKQIIRRPCNFFAIADSLLSVQSAN